MYSKKKSENYQSERHDDRNLPLVTIITICLNSATTLEKTIRSVLQQTYNNIEYIVVDGGSTDGTVDIIKKYEDKISTWRSEPDNGIADAFNKGVALATGEYLQIVNSDDWLSENQIETGLTNLTNSSCDFVFGDTMYHGINAKPLFLYRYHSDYLKVIRRRMPDFNHPTVLARKDMYDKIGGFNTKYKIAMDYDWLLRGCLAGFKGLYIPELTGHMQLCGISDSDYLTSYREIRKISIKNGYPVTLAYWLYFFRVIKSFVRRGLELVFPKRLVLALRGILNTRYDKPNTSS